MAAGKATAAAQALGSHRRLASITLSPASDEQVDQEGCKRQQAHPQQGRAGPAAGGRRGGLGQMHTLLGRSPGIGGATALPRSWASAGGYYERARAHLRGLSAFIPAAPELPAGRACKDMAAERAAAELARAQAAPGLLQMLAQAQR